MNNNNNNRTIIIIGGGIIGLATAHEILNTTTTTTSTTTTNVIILEKEATVGQHQSSHNSGVIHAGIYYKPYSERAKLCVEGSDLMYAFLDKYGIAYNKVGKLIVATTTNQLKQLHKLYDNACINMVKNVSLLTNKDDIYDLEPNVNACGAIYSPNTGIVDYNSVVQQVALVIQSASCGKIITNYNATSVRYNNKNNMINVISNHGSVISGNYVIVCGGLESDRILSNNPDNIIVPIRGRYLQLIPEVCDRVRRNIYPLPNTKYPFLGVHLTPTLTGDKLLGPNAILSLNRDNYDNIYGINMKDTMTMIKHKGFRRFCWQNMRYGIDETLNDMFINRMMNNHLKPMFPWIESHMIKRASQTYTGIRATLINNEGDIVDDFAFEKVPNLPILHVRNAPSPAATSCFAIAKRIVSIALKH